MTDAHRRYLIVEQGVGAAIFNLAVNAGIAWALFRGLSSVPLWGQQSIAGDTIATTFLLPFLTCLIVTRLAQGQVRNGRLPALEWQRATHPALGRLPRGTFLRATVLGAICMVLVAPLALWSLGTLGVAALSFWHFVTFKALFAAVLAALVTPVIALCALGDAPRATAQAA